MILDSENPGALAADLIGWADTLTVATFTIRRFKDDRKALVTVNGRLPEGVPVRAYGSADHGEYARAASAEVEPGRAVSLSLDTMRSVADTAEVRP